MLRWPDLANLPPRRPHRHGDGPWPQLPGLFTGYILPIAGASSNYSLKATLAILLRPPCCWVLNAETAECDFRRLPHTSEAYFPIPRLARPVSTGLM